MQNSSYDDAAVLKLELLKLLPLPFYEALEQFNSAEYFLCRETLEKLLIVIRFL